MSNFLRGLTVICCVAAANAFPPPPNGPPHGPPGGSSGPPGHEYIPPGPFDSRSPCPGLNALANHNYLPHTGQDISFEDISLAAHSAFNFSFNVFLAAFLLANETFSLSTTGSSLTINLRDLARHDTIEADGSQTRNDIYLGDDLHFDATVFAPVAADLGLDDYSGGAAYVTVETAAKARANRQVAAKAVNPTFNASESQVMGSIATTALYLTTMWDFDAEAAPKAWVNAFLGEDRIAYPEGYTAPKTKSLQLLVKMNNVVAAVPV